MKNFIIKTVIVILSIVGITLIVGVAIRKDKSTSIVEIGRKWIEDVFDGISSVRSDIEENRVSGSSIEEPSKAGIDTDPEIIVAVDEAGKPALVTTYYIENEETNESEESSGDALVNNNAISSQISQDNVNLNKSTVNAQDEPNIQNQDMDSGVSIPVTYDEYIKLNINEQIRVANYLGDDFESWLNNLEEHQDDGYIIIDADSGIGIMNQ